LAIRDAARRLGLFFCQPGQRVNTDIATVADNTVSAWAFASAGSHDRCSGRCWHRYQALLVVRSARELLRFCWVLAPNIFYRVTFYSRVQHPLELAAFYLSSDLNVTGWRWYWEEFRQAIMPIAVLGLYQGASWTRYVRSAVLDVIQLDYVTTARAKGLCEQAVMIKHVLRNALIPIVTLVALEMPAIFGGAIVTEQIFRVPGIGSLLISSILANDTPVIMSITFVFSCLVVLFNLIADLLYGWLDPRVSYC
jgi:peptide/nickel transport system permease protein